MVVNPLFTEEPENSTYQNIWANHNQRRRFAEDSKYNLVQGNLLASDQSSLKMTIINLPDHLIDAYSEKNLHVLPSSHKMEITLSILIAATRSLANRYPNLALKGLVLYMDLKAPTLYIFFQQPRTQASAGMPASPSPKETTDEVRPHLHKKTKQPQKSKESKPSDETNSHHQQKLKEQRNQALHLQRQAMAQQTKATTDKEEKKKHQRHKYPEYHHTYQQPTWWQKDDGLTR